MSDDNENALDWWLLWRDKKVQELLKKETEINALRVRVRELEEAERTIWRQALGWKRLARQYLIERNEARGEAKETLSRWYAEACPAEGYDSAKDCTEITDQPDDYCLVCKLNYAKLAAAAFAERMEALAHLVGRYAPIDEWIMRRLGGRPLRQYLDEWVETGKELEE